MFDYPQKYVCNKKFILKIQFYKRKIWVVFVKSVVQTLIQS